MNENDISINKITLLNHQCPENTYNVQIVHRTITFPSIATLCEAYRFRIVISLVCVRSAVAYL